MHVVNLLEHWLGLTNAGGKTYLFWSGFCGDLAFIGGGWAIVRHTNCHVRGCWRVGRHEVRGTHFKVCRKHHPAIDGKPSADDIARAHAEATGA